jgi:hypothetical protein
MVKRFGANRWTETTETIGEEKTDVYSVWVGRSEGRDSLNRIILKWILKKNFYE